jgi:hypothetical protein
MIESLATGKLHGTAKTQTGKNGKLFTTCKVRTPMTNGESVFVNVITFDESVGAGLLALGDGDGVALAGTLSVSTWTNRDGVAKPSIDLVASALLTVHHIRKRRQAMDPSRDNEHQRVAAEYPDFGGQ